MNQVDVRAHPVKRLGVSKKEIAVRLKAVVEVLNYAALRSQIKIDKNVATKNEVDIFYKGHAQIVGEINPAKVDTAANHWLELKLAAHREEVFLAVIRVDVPSAVAPIDGGFGMAQRMLVEVGGENFQRPAFESILGFLEQQHAKGVGLFPGGATRAPYA
jgi:hypothetical protein